MPGALLLAPDEEAGRWVERRRGVGPRPCGVREAAPPGDRDVQVGLHGAPVRGRAVVILDDVASTGRTLAAAARAALAAGAARVDVAVTHALFVGDALEHVRAAGVGEVWSSDCVPHASNAVSVVPLLAQGLEPVMG
ncbi:MAG: phosphoribosyltransferase family protein [Rubrivivax sp.]